MFRFFPVKRNSILIFREKEEEERERKGDDNFFVSFFSGIFSLGEKIFIFINFSFLCFCLVLRHQS